MVSPTSFGLGFGNSGKKTESTTSEAGFSKPQPSASTKGKKKETTTTVSDMSTSAEQQAATSKSFWSSLSSVPSPSSKTLYGLGAAALGAAALGTAYYRREDFITGWRWGYDHMTFVKNLWDEDGSRKRLEAIDALVREQNVLYRKYVDVYSFLWEGLLMHDGSYYTHLPVEPPVHLVGRTFAILPPASHPLFPLWRPATNSLAKDEVSAHMGMFNPKTNDGFYDLGLAVVKEIGERIESEGVGRKEGLEERMDEDGEGVWRIEKDKDGKEIWVEA